MLSVLLKKCVFSFRENFLTPSLKKNLEFLTAVESIHGGLFGFFRKGDLNLTQVARKKYSSDFHFS